MTSSNKAAMAAGALALLAACGAGYFWYGASASAAPSVLQQAPALAKSTGAPIETFTLKNGMEVVLLTDRRVPAVTHMLWYRVGAADDYPGRSGLAHYNEHMMFQGSEKVKSGEYMREVGRYGGQTNAFTSHDYTGYYVTIAREQLPMVMRMEADRMLHLAPSEEHFAKEREVIIEERRSAIDNRPEALLSEEMQALLLRSHPYRIPNIGWKHEMETLSREDVLAFHRAFYHPANAVLVVAGDIDRPELEKLASEYYGGLPAGEKYTRRWASEPPQRGPRRTELRHPNVREELLMRFYTAPSAGTGGEAQLLPSSVLAQLLGGGPTSALYQSLIVRQKLAVALSVFYDGFAVGPGALNIVARPAPGVSLPTLEAALDKEIAAFLAATPGADDLARAKTLMKADAVFTRDGAEGMARVLGMLVMTGLPVSYFNEWPERVDAVTAQQVQDAARAIFDARQSVTGYLLPESEAK